MTDISESQNLDAHYTTNAKVVRPTGVVVSGPNNIPKTHVYSDIDANKRLYAINQDIFVDSKKFPQKTKKKKFLGLF